MTTHIHTQKYCTLTRWPHTFTPRSTALLQDDHTHSHPEVLHSYKEKIPPPPSPHTHIHSHTEVLHCYKKMTPHPGTHTYTFRTRNTVFSQDPPPPHPPGQRHHINEYKIHTHTHTGQRHHIKYTHIHIHTQKYHTPTRRRRRWNITGWYQGKGRELA